MESFQKIFLLQIEKSKSRPDYTHANIMTISMYSKLQYIPHQNTIFLSKLVPTIANIVLTLPSAIPHQVAFTPLSTLICQIYIPLSRPQQPLKNIYRYKLHWLKQKRNWKIDNPNYNNAITVNSHVAWILMQHPLRGLFPNPYCQILHLHQKPNR